VSGAGHLSGPMPTGPRSLRPPERRLSPAPGERHGPAGRATCFHPSTDRCSATGSLLGAEEQLSKHRSPPPEPDRGPTRPAPQGRPRTSAPRSFSRDGRRFPESRASQPSGERSGDVPCVVSSAWPRSRPAQPVARPAHRSPEGGRGGRKSSGTVAAWKPDSVLDAQSTERAPTSRAYSDGQGRLSSATFSSRARPDPWASGPVP